MEGVTYSQGGVPIGERVGRCPRCRSDQRLSEYPIHVAVLGQHQGRAGTFYVCPACGVQLTDAGFFGRIVRAVLLSLFVFGICSLARGASPLVTPMFTTPSETTVTDWVLLLLTSGAMGFGVYLGLRSLRRLFVSRYVETDGVYAGL